MTDIISLKPLYVPVVQKPQCCGPAVLQMIVYRNAGILLDQEGVAMELGVMVSRERLPAFSRPMPVFTQFNFDEGMQTVESAGRVNDLFHNHAIKLCAASVKSSTIPALADFIEGHIRANHDLWVEYHTDETTGDDINAAIKFSGKPRKSAIHDGLIESFDLGKSEITLIDPGPAVRQRRIVKLDSLARSISTQYGRETGFLVVSRTSVAGELGL